MAQPTQYMFTISKSSRNATNPSGTQKAVIAMAISQGDEIQNFVHRMMYYDKLAKHIATYEGEDLKDAGHLLFEQVTMQGDNLMRIYVTRAIQCRDYDSHDVWVYIKNCHVLEEDRPAVIERMRSLVELHRRIDFDLRAKPLLEKLPVHKLTTAEHLFRQNPGAEIATMLSLLYRRFRSSSPDSWWVELDYRVPGSEWLTLDDNDNEIVATDDNDDETVAADDNDDVFLDSGEFAIDVTTWELYETA